MGNCRNPPRSPQISRSNSLWHGYFINYNFRNRTDSERDQGIDLLFYHILECLRGSWCKSWTANSQFVHFQHLCVFKHRGSEMNWRVLSLFLLVLKEQELQGVCDIESLHVQDKQSSVSLRLLIPSGIWHCCRQRDENSWNCPRATFYRDQDFHQ